MLQRSPIALVVLLPSIIFASANCSKQTVIAAPADGGSPLTDDAAATTPEPAPAPDPTGFRTTGSLRTARRSHTSTVLNDGRVLVVGGEAGGDLHMLDSAEIFDPETEKWSALPTLPAARSNHTATLLADGRVLIAGGGKSSIIGEPSGEEVLTSALLFDPSTDTFRETGALHVARSGHGAVRLKDGRVIVAGGGADTVMGPCPPQYPDCFIANPLASAEIYDPGAGSFTEVASLAVARHSFSLIGLTTGEAIAVGGAKKGGGGTPTAEIFDPVALSWKSGGDLSVDRLHPSATRLGSGKVLVAAGKKADVGPLATAELFENGTWSKTAELDGARNGSILVTLTSGNGLIVGGYDQIEQKILDTAAIYDQASASWMPIKPLKGERSLHSVVVLKTGQALVCGGATAVGRELKTCELSE